MLENILGHFLKISTLTSPMATPISIKIAFFNFVEWHRMTIHWKGMDQDNIFQYFKKNEHQPRPRPCGMPISLKIAFFKLCPTTSYEGSLERYNPGKRFGTFKKIQP